MALTDLTNTTWILNDTLSSYPGGTYNLKTYNINITTETPLPYSGDTEDTFVAIMIGYDSGGEYNKILVLTSLPQSYYNFSQLAEGHDTKSLPDTWNSYYDKSFTITGGTDATNSTLIAWLEQNATTPPAPDVVVTYNNNDIVTMTDSDVKTLATSGTYCTDDIKITFTKQSGGGSTGYTYIAEDVNYGSVKLGNVPALTASGTNSVAQGSSSTASGDYSHAEGSESRAGGKYSHAEGSGNHAGGDASHAEGNGSIANAYAAHAEGNKSRASSYAAHAEGNAASASGSFSHAEGYQTLASTAGQGQHAEGYATTAAANYAHAEGQNTYASSTAAHAEGYGTTATGAQSHAEGYQTFASTASAHAEGDHTTASGYASHAQGNLNLASGEQAFVSGYQSTASHRNSIAVGMNVKTSHSEQAVFGAFNADDSTALLLVGHGSSGADADRSNAFAVHNDGRVSAGANATASEDLVRLGQILDFQVNKLSGDVTCSNGSWCTPTSAQLNSTGLYLVSAHVDFASSSAGRRTIILTSNPSGNTGNVMNHQCMDTRSPVNGDKTTCSIVTILNVTQADYKIYCRAWQNSGSNRTVTGSLRAVKLK